MRYIFLFYGQLVITLGYLNVRCYLCPSRRLSVCPSVFFHPLPTCYSTIIILIFVIIVIRPQK